MQKKAADGPSTDSGIVVGPPPEPEDTATAEDTGFDDTGFEDTLDTEDTGFEDTAFEDTATEDTAT